MAWYSLVAQIVSAYNVGDLGSIPGLGRSSGEGNGNPLQYSCLENTIDRGAWWNIVHGVTESRIWLKRLSIFAHGKKNNVIQKFFSNSSIIIRDNLQPIRSNSFILASAILSWIHNLFRETDSFIYQLILISQMFLGKNSSKLCNISPPVEFMF